ncbi:putative transmembrane protein [Toxoplasma gondii RUB]|uniref:Putative transmembrane protein n=1 Tax=Toxoplasma gondii RUB TaxID=935652 RepID=A0A086M438_TOXGO|nr:putative transmembrane protein [Toxoplasma gondii RUB]
MLLWHSVSNIRVCTGVQSSEIVLLGFAYLLVELVAVSGWPFTSYRGEPTHTVSRDRRGSRDTSFLSVRGFVRSTVLLSPRFPQSHPFLGCRLWEGCFCRHCGQLPPSFTPTLC